jgi:hypothetical protein
MVDEASGALGDGATCPSCGATVRSGLRICPECGAYLTAASRAEQPAAWQAVSPSYPVTVAVDYPERQSRWRALLRLPLVIPLVVFSYLLSNGVALAIWAAILVSGRIPRWLFDFQVALNRWELRFLSYSLLLTDQYPPFEGDHPVRYDVQYPERLSRWKLVFWKFITSIPHVFLLCFFAIALVAVVPISWFSILIAGRYPRGLHQYVVDVLRWGARVSAYAFSLTDEFPPFSLSADAGPGGKDSYVIASVVGLLATAGIVAMVVVGIVFLQPGEKVVEVSYERLLSGDLSSAETRVSVDSVTVELTAAADPAIEVLPFLVPQPDHRFVLVNLFVANTGRRDLRVREGDFHVTDRKGDGHDAILVVADGRIAPVRLRKGGIASVDLLFELPQGVDPAELHYDLARIESESVVYEFR